VCTFFAWEDTFIFISYPLPDFVDDGPGIFNYVVVKYLDILINVVQVLSAVTTFDNLPLFCHEFGDRLMSFRLILLENRMI